MKFTFINIILCTFTHFVSLYGTRPYISLLAVENGADHAIIGLIASLYSIIQVLIALPISQIIDKYGPRLPIVYGSFILIISGAGLSIAHNLAFIGLCSFLLGLSHGLVLLSLQYSVTSLCIESGKDKYVGIYTFANSAGTLFGPLFGGYSHGWLGNNQGFLVTLAVAVISTISAFFIPNDKKEKKQEEPFSIRQLLENPRILRTLVVSCVVLFSTDITINYFPLYGKEIGLSIIAIGTVLSISGTASMLARPLLGKLNSLFSREKVLKFCLVCGGAGLACYSLFHTYNSLLVVAFCSGGFIGLLNPLTMITIADIAPQGELSKVLALRVMGNFLGQTISPLAFGMIALAIGLSPIFLVSGTGLALCSLLVDK